MDVSRRSWFGGVAATALGVATQAGAQAPGAMPSRASVVPPGPVLTNAASRSVQDLSGMWNWSIDPYRGGLAGFHGEPPGASQQRYKDVDVDAETRAHPRELFEFDMQRSAEAHLPGAWLADEPSLRQFVGLMWYQRKFSARN